MSLTLKEYKERRKALDEKLLKARLELERLEKESRDLEIECDIFMRDKE